jgi:hypothetical protein
MTPYQIRERQRLQSESDRQALEGIARARRAALERDEALARRRRWLLILVALGLTVLAVIFGWWREIR